MDFEPCFKVYNLVSLHPKSMKLGPMTNHNVIFHMVGSIYRLVTIRNLRNGLKLIEVLVLVCTCTLKIFDKSYKF